MRLLLDQGLPRSSVRLLEKAGVDAVHTGECGLERATDAHILERAREEGRIVVTLDADFHALMALSGAEKPSVIRVRVEGLRSEALAQVLRQTLDQCKAELEKGALVSVTAHQVRLRRLPIRPSNAG